MTFVCLFALKTQRFCVIKQGPHKPALKQTTETNSFREFQLQPWLQTEFGKETRCQADPRKNKNVSLLSRASERFGVKNRREEEEEKDKKYVNIHTH